MLVRMVTPMSRGRWRWLATASAAASIMRRPPDVCISTIHTPMSAATRQAAATVLGMSWYLRSRKSWKPWLIRASARRRPVAVNSSLPILRRHKSGLKRRTKARVSASLAKSRATITGVRRAGGAESRIRGFIEIGADGVEIEKGYLKAVLLRNRFQVAFKIKHQAGAWGCRFLQLRQ